MYGQRYGYHIHDPDGQLPEESIQENAHTNSQYGRNNTKKIKTRKNSTHQTLYIIIGYYDE